MNKQQIAWLKDGIEYLRRIHRWGQPDGLEVALTCEEYVQEGNILAHRVGAEHLACDKEPSPEPRWHCSAGWKGGYGRACPMCPH